MWLRKKFLPDYTGVSITQSDYVQVDWNTAREIAGLIDSTYTVVENAAGLDSTAADVVEELNSIDIDCNDFKNIFSDVLEKLTSAVPVLGKANSKMLSRDVLAAFTAFFVRVGTVRKILLPVVIKHFSEVLRSKGISAAYLGFIKARLLNDCLLSYVLEPNAGKACRKEISALLKAGADPTVRYGAHSEFEFGQNGVDVVVSRGYANIFKNIVSSERFNKEAAEAVLNSPALGRPDWVPAEEITGLLSYAFRNLVQPADGDGKFFRLCAMYEKWDMAETGLKAYSDKGGNVEAFVECLVATLGEKREGYGKRFSGSLTAATNSYERLRNIAGTIRKNKSLV